jgi:hypothetical protein
LQNIKDKHAAHSGQKRATPYRIYVLPLFVVFHYHSKIAGVPYRFFFIVRISYNFNRDVFVV